MIKHIVKVWGEAVRQLESTANYYGIKDCIKIILVYDDYFPSECLDELFKLNTNLTNDRNYWLLNIREFEILIMLYRQDRELFKKIMNEKIELERSVSNNGRELFAIFKKHNITNNIYLDEYGIKVSVKYPRVYLIPTRYATIVSDEIVLDRSHDRIRSLTA